jgi:hypothetical protein
MTPWLLISDAQRLAKRKVQKQWEIDHCAFDPEHMEEVTQPQHQQANNGGGSFAMVCTENILIIGNNQIPMST